MSDDKLMRVLIFILCFMVNVVLMLTILTGMSLLGQFGILIIVDFVIYGLSYKAEISTFNTAAISWSFSSFGIRKSPS